MKKRILLSFTIMFPVILFCTTWTVKQDQTGDFETIGDALASLAVVNGDEIVVYEGTYYENVIIDKNITLCGRGENYVSTTIVDGSQDPAGNVIALDDELSDVIIKWLTIQSNSTSSGKGINIQNNEVLVKDCIITNIMYGIYIQGWGQPYRIPRLQNNIIHDNYVGISCSGGIMPAIIGNEIYSNTFIGIKLSGAIIVPDPSIRIAYNKIYGHNQASSKALFSDLIPVYTAHNLYYDNTYSIFTNNEPSLLDLKQDTFYHNEYFINEVNTLNIENCIIWDNRYFLPSPLAPGPMPYTINYSCIQHTEINYNGGEGVITQDPLVNDPLSFNLSLEWSSTAKSPCIDAGDPNSPLDPDGTRADMGALYHHHLEKEYLFEGPDGPHDGWTWLCFDILDIYNPEVTNQVQYLLDLIKLNLDHGEHEGLQFSYNSQTEIWAYGTELVTSPKGYKIQMTDEDSFEVSGFRCKESTPIDIFASAPVGNWIGYFLGRTQHVYDSFNGYLGNIYSIQHQDWSIDGSCGWPDVNYTLSPGDMVIVYCYDDIIDFRWMDDQETERFLIAEPQMFTFTEEADYLPIYVELDENDLPDEIAVFVDNECKGARVVQHTLENICSYVTELQSGSIEIEFAYYGREANQRHNKYTIIDPETGNREDSTIDLGEKSRMYYISFRSEEGNSSELPKLLTSSNYPNPFNPSTVISYDLPQESRVSISIYNLKGQKVKELINGNQPSGNYKVEWNGEDEHGKAVSSGIYYYRLEACGRTLHKKMIMLK